MARMLATPNQPTPQAPLPKLAVFIRANDGVPFEDGWDRAKDEGIILASNKRLAQALATKEWKALEEALPCHSGTMTAYDEPGKKLDNVIVYIDPHTKIRWIFPTGTFKGEKDFLLVLEHPDYTIEPDGKDKVVKPTNPNLIDFVPDFPRRDGWYFVDPKHGIPRGLNMADGHGSYLARIDARVGPVRLCDFYLGWVDGRRVVGLEGEPSEDLGMVVEIKDGDPGQISDQEPRGKLILLPGVSQLPEPKILDQYRELYEAQVKQALADLFRPYDPKYPRY